MPTVHVWHSIFVEVHEDLPTSCPHCHAWFEDEDERNLVVHRVCRTEGKTSLISGTDNWEDNHFEQDDTEDPGLVIGFSCRRCKTPVIWPHARSWILEAMSSKLASQLRTLLYDSNVLVERIRKKVFGT